MRENARCNLGKRHMTSKDRDSEGGGEREKTGDSEKGNFFADYVFF